MKKIHYDAVDGTILGIYSDAVHGAENIPTPHVVVDDAVWQDIVSNPGRRRVDLATGEITVYIPEPQPDPFPVLSRVQLLLALLDLGKTEADVDAVIGAMSEPDKTVASIRWKNGRSFARDDAFVVQIILALGLTDADVDPVWRNAAGY